MQGRARHVRKTATTLGTVVFPTCSGRFAVWIKVSVADVRITLDGTTPSATNGYPVPVDGELKLGHADGVPGGEVIAWSSGGTGIVDAFEIIPFN